MIQLTQKFTAHPVGQGLFYTGYIAINSHRENPAVFNFVFDCGSLNATNATEEVANYRDLRLPGGTNLDLLVISHFDADHVSHISELLEGPKKVKKVVLPFATLEERLYLVLRYKIMHKNGGKGKKGGGSPIDFMLNPLGSLGKYLDKDSTLYIAHPDKANEPFDNNDTNVSDDLGSDTNFEFSIPNEAYSGAELTDIQKAFGFSPEQLPYNVRKFNDSEKGLLKYDKAIMEFLFYRRNIGSDEEAFFKEVYKEFVKERQPAKEKLSLDELIEEVKKIKGAGDIKKIFRRVEASFKGRRKFLVSSGRDISNPNTTALCMLHNNLGNRRGLKHYCRKINIIKKFDGTNRTRIEDDSEHHFYLNWCYDHSLLRFPNCLLTSDTFLKEGNEVEELYKRYKNYWGLFWLFQLPHHGSENNAGLPLLSRLPNELFKFINYGTTHNFKWKHPSPQLIMDLVAAGQSVNVLPVNEFTGLSFELNGRFNL